MAELSFTSTEFQKAFGRIREAALKDPVTITHHGRDSLVLISAEEYRRLKRLEPRALYPWELSEQDISALEAPLAEASGADFDHEWKP